MLLQCLLFPTHNWNTIAINPSPTYTSPHITTTHYTHILGWFLCTEYRSESSHQSPGLSLLLGDTWRHTQLSRPAEPAPDAGSHGLSGYHRSWTLHPLPNPATWPHQDGPTKSHECVCCVQQMCGVCGVLACVCGVLACVCGVLACVCGVLACVCVCGVLACVCFCMRVVCTAGCSLLVSLWSDTRTSYYKNHYIMYYKICSTLPSEPQVLG